MKKVLPKFLLFFYLLLEKTFIGFDFIGFITLYLYISSHTALLVVQFILSIFFVVTITL